MQNWRIEGENIFFENPKMCLHVSVLRLYRGMSFKQARNKMKNVFIYGAASDAIISMLKERNLLKFVQF